MATTATSSYSGPTTSESNVAHVDGVTSPPTRHGKKQSKSPTTSVFERLRRNRRQSPLFQRTCIDSGSCIHADGNVAEIGASASAAQDARHHVKRDLFGVHIELYNLLIETERRKLKTLHSEMQQLSSSFPSLHNSRKYQHISYAKQRLGRLQAQLDQLEDEYRRAAYGALKSNHVNIGGCSKSKLVAEYGTHTSHNSNATSSASSSSTSSSSTKAAQLAAPPPMVKQQTVRTRPSIFGSLAALSPRATPRCKHNNATDHHRQQQTAINGNVDSNNILNPPTLTADVSVTSSSLSVPHSSPLFLTPRNTDLSLHSSPSNCNNSDANLLTHSTTTAGEQQLRSSISPGSRNNNTPPPLEHGSLTRRDPRVTLPPQPTPEPTSTPSILSTRSHSSSSDHRQDDEGFQQLTLNEEKPSEQQYYRCVIPVVHNSASFISDDIEMLTRNQRYRSTSAVAKIRTTAAVAAKAKPPANSHVLSRIAAPPAIPASFSTSAALSSSTPQRNVKNQVHRLQTAGNNAKPAHLVHAQGKAGETHNRQPHTTTALKQHVRSTSAKGAPVTSAFAPHPLPNLESVIQVKKNGATIVSIGGAATKILGDQNAQKHLTNVHLSDTDTDTDTDDTDDDLFAPHQDEQGTQCNDVHCETLCKRLSTSSAIDYQLLTPTHTRDFVRGTVVGGPPSTCSSSVDSAILRESSCCTHEDELAASMPSSISPVIAAIASMSAVVGAENRRAPRHDDCISASDSNYHSSSGSSIGVSGVGSTSGGSDCDANSIQSRKVPEEGENSGTSRPSSSLLSQPLPVPVLHELRYENGTLASGTLESLIAYFMPTSKHVPERTYSFAFILSCRLFLQPEELLERVEILCNEHAELCESKISASAACSSPRLPAKTRKQELFRHTQDLASVHSDSTVRVEVAGFRHNLCVNEQETKAFCRHINRLLSDWAETFPYDFRQDFLMLRFKTLSAFCVRYEPLLSVELDHTLQSLLQKLAELDEYEQHLARISQATLERMKSAVNLTTSTTDVVQICPNAMLFAQQLTHVELERMQFIGPEEFVKAISDVIKKKPSSSPSAAAATKTSKLRNNNRRRLQLHNLDAYVDWFNRLSYLVATEVCMQLRRKHRVRLIDFFIEVAKECFNLGNYNSLMAIVAGLNMSPVRRLKRTWQRVSNTVKLDVLENAMSPSQNFLHYRSTLKAAMWRSAGSTTVTEKIIVPFFSLLIKDVYFLKEGCSGTLQDGTINFTKFWQLAKQVSEFLAWREVVCPFDRRPNVIDYVLTTAVFSETGLALASFECEAPETANERDRCRQLKLALNQAPGPNFLNEVR